MCGRYTLYETDGLEKRYNLAVKPQFVSRDNYNVAPRQYLPIVRQEDGKRVAEQMQWGFLPFFAKEPSKSFRPINTVSETAFEKPMWRQAIMHHRCLVPARGFYEWKQTADGSKTPYYIHPRDLPLFSFAGIYSIWKDVEDKPFYSFSILTTAPNAEMADIHDRMPVILRPEEETAWLDVSKESPDEVGPLMRPFADGELEIYRVSSDVNSPKHNDRHLIEAVPA